MKGAIVAACVAVACSVRAVEPGQSTGEQQADKRLAAFAGGPIRAVVFDYAGQAVISTGDRNVDVQDSATGKLLRRFSAHDVEGSALAVSSDDSYIASGDLSGVIRVWRRDTGSVVWSTKGRADLGTLAFVSASPDSVLSASSDRTLRLWVRGELYYRLEIPGWRGSGVNRGCCGSDVGSIAVHRGTAFFVCLDGYIYQAPQDLSDIVEIAQMPARNSSYPRPIIQIDRNGRWTTAAADDSTVSIHRATGALNSLRNQGAGTITALAASHDGSSIAIGTDSGAVTIFDVETGRAKSQWTTGEIVYGLALSPDGKRVAVSGANRAVSVFSAESAKPVWQTKNSSSESRSQ